MPDFKAKDLVGKKVVLKDRAYAKNGLVLPKGLALDAVGFGSALHLRSGPCPACGVAVELRNVPKRYYEPAGGRACPEYPVAAVWQPSGAGFVECSRCHAQARIGDDPVTCAAGIDPGDLHWRACPHCGAGMALPEQLR